MTDLRSDPLSTALACVRRLSDEGLAQLVGEIREEQTRRYAASLISARWLTTHRLEARRKKHRKTCLVDPATYDQLRYAISGGRWSGYTLTPAPCALNAHGIFPEGRVTCPECLRSPACPEEARA